MGTILITILLVLLWTWMGILCLHILILGIMSILGNKRAIIFLTYPPFIEKRLEFIAFRPIRAFGSIFQFLYMDCIYPGIIEPIQVYFIKRKGLRILKELEEKQKRGTR